MMRMHVLGITLTDDGVELIVTDEADERQGMKVAHSYLVNYDSEPFGPRAKDLFDEIEDLAEDVHRGWRRAPKVAAQ